MRNPSNLGHLGDYPGNPPQVPQEEGGEAVRSGAAVGRAVHELIGIATCVAIFIALHWQMPVVWIAGIPYLALLCGSYFVLRSFRYIPKPAKLPEGH